MNQPSTVAIAPLLVSLPDAAKALGVGRSTIYELMRAKKLESVAVGRRRMIPEVAIRDYVDRLRASQKAAPVATQDDDFDYED
ncbi:helix-turn-helix domain-containing protein [Xanthobacter autotrophicus]|uniref:helix-turn-helix domain-containing protein n=1 Tax=Xanthobacter autotrophicus TaxID=280 RepID=UPI00372C4DEA